MQKGTFVFIRLGEEHPSKCLFGSDVVVSSPKTKKSNIQSSVSYLLGWQIALVILTCMTSINSL